MQPAARIAAAIELLDEVLDGVAAEKALTGWARRSRFAGSKDRAAIRDFVFDALRCRASFAALGGAQTGRGLMIGMLRASGADLTETFNGVGHAPVALSPEEEALSVTLDELPDAARLDFPEWLMPMIRADLGDDTEAALEALRHRAPIFVRVNTGKTDVAKVIAALDLEDIAARPVTGVDGALEITSNERKLKNSPVYLDGMVEMQDASSQAAVLQLTGTGTALDYCAGGGGKALGLAALGWQVTAHDIAENRMADIPERASRASVAIDVRGPDDLGDGEYDLVFADAPCSGSGTWRRAPDAKWRLTPERLDELTKIQTEVLTGAAAYTAPNGTLAYATCSLLSCENDAIVNAFCAQSNWEIVRTMKRLPNQDGDGFFLAMLKRK